jgi:predicted polyphosphate/ATP-dependent NAD kinase
VKCLGFIINPLAGIGGRVGLKGSDGLEIQRQALELGAKPEAPLRASLALHALKPLKQGLELLTCPAEMGEVVARQGGFEPQVVGQIASGATTAEDTRRAAQEMQHAGVDLLLFAGGDGTARDIYSAIKTGLPTLGIPCGVKIYSAVFAINPRLAGELAAAYFQGQVQRLREAEVIDLDEEAYRSGAVATRLFGYLKIPYLRMLVQNQKAPTPAGEAATADAIAWDVVERMQPDCLYILGPGTTTRAIAKRLGFPKTLVGVDVVTPQRVIALDVSEAQLLKLVGSQPARIVLSPIGGQGFLLGRGNLQISPRVVQQVSQVELRVNPHANLRQSLIVISTPDKLNALRGQPLWVDTGDAAVDSALSGYIQVITGYHEVVVYRIAS